MDLSYDMKRLTTLRLMFFLLLLKNNITALTFSSYSNVLAIHMMLRRNNMKSLTWKTFPQLHSRMHTINLPRSNTNIIENNIQQTTYVKYTFPLYCSNKVRCDSQIPEYDKSTKLEKIDKDIQSIRIATLHEKIKILSSSIDPDDLALASHKALTTTEGYDPEYGKSAIKAYRTFLKYPPSNPNEDVTVAATRTARQIDFLVKRHKSRALEWVRHTDEDAKKRSLFPLSLILDNVRSAFNVGSIFRTADACGCMEVITTGITPHPDGSGREKLSKCALGADAIVPTRHFSTTMEAIETLRSEDDVMLVGMETTDRSLLYTDENIIYPKHGKGTYLILGNEVSGIDTEIIDMLLSTSS